MSTNKKIIIAILLIIVTAGIYYFYTKSSENASTTKYERIYSYLTGWSDLKKDYYKAWRLKDYSNWFYNDNVATAKDRTNLRDEAEGGASMLWKQGKLELPNHWAMHWEEYRSTKNLDINGFNIK